MATVVIAMLPEWSHLTSSLKLGKRLMARGHEIYQAGLSDYEPFLRLYGFKFIPVFQNLYQPGVAAQSTQRSFSLLQSLMEQNSGERTPQGVERILLSEVDRIASTCRPDLFIVDGLIPEFALVTRKTGRQTLLLHTILYDNFETNPIYSTLAGVPELILCPKEFDFPRPERSQRNLHYVEASIDLEREEPSFDWTGFEDGCPLIYCALGSQSHLYQGAKEFFQTAINAMTASPKRRMIISIGHKLDHSDFDNLPSNVRLVKNAPQLEILKKASLMITHGGLNSVKECIYAGVPMIVLPQLSEQPKNAVRVEFHGLGLRGNMQKLTVEQLLSKIAQIEANPRFKEQVLKFRDIFRKAEASCPSIDIIESLLAADFN